MTKRSKIIFNIILNVILVFAIVCCAYFAFYSFCFFTTHVEGESMQPTFNVEAGKQDKILASKIAGIDRGDVVIIHTGELDSKGNEKFIIKRVIALGGDSIDMAMNGDLLEITVNGIKISEPQYAEPIHYPVPPNTFIAFTALKSNWQGEKNDKGIIIPNEQVFVLGDNRENSLDSSQRGPYLMKNVTAKVLCAIDENAFAPIELLKTLF